MDPSLPLIHKATCSSTRNNTLRQELVNIRKKHEVFIRRHRCEKPSHDVNNSDKLSVQYQLWGSWFSKRGYNVRSHISKREFAKLKTWFTENADIGRSSQTVTIDFMHDSLVLSGLYSNTDAIKLFNLAGVDLVHRPPLSFEAVSKLLSPDNPVQLNIARQFIGCIQPYNDEGHTERLAGDFDVDASAVEGADTINSSGSLSGETIDSADDGTTVAAQESTSQRSSEEQQQRCLARLNSDTVQAARKVRNKVKELRRLSRTAVVTTLPTLK
jgi:hypothetical protein